jgi:UDP-glucose:(heptosyl)LPS alpha-1,3-glucosyltransferase
MQIGLVRRGYSASGGAERYLLRFAAALRDAGHRAVLFCSQEWPDKAEGFEGESFRLPGRTPLEFARNLAALKPREHCDFVFSLERVFACDCYRAGDGIHRSWMRRRERLDNPLRRWIRHLRGKHREILQLEEALFVRRGAELALANSDLVRRELMECYPYPEERIRVVHNGIPAKTLVPSGVDRYETRARLGVERDAFVMIFLGSGWERKGLRCAMEATAQLASASKPRLLVVGSGRKPRGVPDERVRLLGPVADPKPYLEAADLFVLPTVYDPFSNACLEAAAAGLPVLTTKANGFADLLVPGVHGESLEDPFDAAALARAMEEWSDPEKRMHSRDPLIELARSRSIEANLRETLAALGLT